MIAPPSISRLAPWSLLLPLVPLLAPLPEALQEPPAPHAVLRDRNGQELTHFPRDDYFRHHPATLDEIPEHLVKATLAAEDKRFFEHPGIDYAATLRAFRDNSKHQRITSGASTITQQLIKISTPAAERNWQKKVSEVLAARRLESQWSKEEILTAYLNRLDYGSHQQGCSAAARHFFGKPLADLSLAESALLAGLPQAPSRLNPHRNPQGALIRRNWILNRLQSEFYYDDNVISRAKAEPILLADRSIPNPIPHLARDYDGATRLSIDADLQRETHTILTDELARLREKNVQHGALVVLHNPTGEILAFHGSSDFASPNGGQINGALAPRSAGSTLKPFTYLLAFQNQLLFPGSIIADIPTDYQTEEGLDAPKNFDRRHYGPVSIRHALANSLNVSAMRMLNQVGGPEPLHRLLTELDLTTLHRQPTKYGLGLTIGNAEVNLLELTNAYATLARLGEHLSTTFLPDQEPTSSYPFTGDASYLVTDILADNSARSAAFGIHSNLRLPFPCAVKTGTSSDFRDNWCLGFTGEFTVGVWVGNFDNSPMAGISGVSGASPIFHRTMLALHEGQRPTFPKQPATLARISIDARTGHRFLISPAQNTPFQRRELCFKNHRPLPISPIDFTKENKALLSLEYAEWFMSEDNTKRHAFALADSKPPLQESLQILTPLPNATYYLDPELPGNFPELNLKANLTDGHWLSDTLNIQNGVAQLTPGEHTITLVNPDTGQEVTCQFQVELL